MHDPFFDHRLDPKAIPLLHSIGAEILGTVILTVGTLAPVVFVAGLIGATGVAAP